MKILLKQIALMLGFVTVLQVNAVDSLDLSKISMKNTNQPYAKVITGGQPSLEDLKILKKLGVTRVINLRTQGEFEQFDEAETVKQLGIDYIKLEIPGAKGVTMKNATKLNEILKQKDELTLVHCASSNRVGALFALIASGIEGKNLEESLQEGQKAGLKSLYNRTRQTIQSMQ